MKYTTKIRKAIRFAVKVHEVDQKQKRKGKDIAYITHPLTVALILSQARAKEEVVIAGLLHDTIEDCSMDCLVTRENIVREFGKDVAGLVDSVTEPESNLPWTERKKQVCERVKTFSKEMVLLKSADVIANGTEIIDDYEENGESVFERFNASKKEKLESQIKLIEVLIAQYENSSLVNDLEELKDSFKKILISE